MDVTNSCSDRWGHPGTQPAVVLPGLPNHGLTVKFYVASWKNNWIWVQVLVCTHCAVFLHFWVGLHKQWWLSFTEHLWSSKHSMLNTLYTLAWFMSKITLARSTEILESRRWDLANEVICSRCSVAEPRHKPRRSHSKIHTFHHYILVSTKKFLSSSSTINKCQWFCEHFFHQVNPWTTCIWTTCVYFNVDLKKINAVNVFSLWF